MSVGVCLDYGSPFTLTNNSPCVVPGEKGDITVSQPFNIIMVPLVACKLKAAIEKKITEKGPTFQQFFQICLDYKLKCTEKGFRTSILDFFVFGRIAAVFGGKLRNIGVGGALVQPEIKRFMSLILPDVSVTQAYGITETCGGGFVQTRHDITCDEVGYNTSVVPVMLETWEEGGYTVDDHEGPSGEIIIGGTAVAEGYYNHNDVADNEAFFTEKDGSRWFRTGDIGRCNSKTYAFSVIDRKKQLIKLQNGKYLSLSRIESALNATIYVENSCVFVETEKMFVVAIIVPDEDNCSRLLSGGSGDFQTVLFEALKKELVKQDFSPIEIPKAIRLVQGPWNPESGLVTAAMKIKRLAIKEAFNTEISEMMA